MSRFCPNCGAQLNDAAVLCTKCGLTLPAAAPQQPAGYQQPVQPQQPAGYQQPMQPQQPAGYQQPPAQGGYPAPQPAPQKSKTGVIVAVVAVAVLVIAAVVLLILKPWDKKDDDKEDTRPAATQEAKTEEDDKTEAPAPSNDDTIDYKAGGISVPIPADYIKTGTQAGAQYYAYSANGDVISIMVTSTNKSTLQSDFNSITEDLVKQAYANNPNLSSADLIDFDEGTLNGLRFKAAYLQMNSMDCMDVYFLSDEAIVEVSFIFTDAYSDIFSDVCSSITKA